jgi:type I restriction enzyme S subunit
MKHKWPTTKLGEVLTERRETPTDDDLASGRVRIVEKISFDSGRIQLRVDGSTKTGMILVRPGDLVVSGINAAKGAIAIYDANAVAPVAATIHYGAYEINHQRADVRFLWWMLRSHFFQDLLLEFVPGGIKTELKAKRLLPVPVPLPPLAEQRRVVARIEELAAQIHEARTLRDQAAKQTEALPLAELSTVFHQQRERFGTLRLEGLLTEAGYGSSEKCDSERMEGGSPVLRIPNVASERITLNNLKFARLSDRDSQRLLLSEGDVLVVRTNGSLELVGRSAVVPKLDEPFAFASYMIRLRFDRKRIAPDYAQRMLQHLRVAGVLVDFARTTAGQYNVSLGRLRSAEIPVPPLPEQRRIVSELDALQAEVDALKRLQVETAAELDALLPSILDRAFKGEL